MACETVDAAAVKFTGIADAAAAAEAAEAAEAGE
jgi:hypothetical protein